MSRRQRTVAGVEIEVLEPSNIELTEATPVTTLQIRVNSESGVVSVFIPRGVMEGIVELWLGPDDRQKTHSLKQYGITFE